MEDSTESEAWHRFFLKVMELLPLIVPGAELQGSVAPNIFIPYLITSFPCHIIATTGPDVIAFIIPLKNDFSFNSS